MSGSWHGHQSGRAPPLNGGVFSRRIISKIGHCIPTLRWGYQEWLTFYNQLVNLIVGAPTVSLWVQQVDILHSRRRAQSKCLIIQNFLRGYLCLYIKVDNKPAPCIVGRSTSPSSFRGPFLNFPVIFLKSTTPYHAVCCFPSCSSCVFFTTLSTPKGSHACVLSHLCLDDAPPPSNLAMGHGASTTFRACKRCPSHFGRA